MVTMTVAHPDRERRNTLEMPAIALRAPITAVIGSKAGPTTVVGPIVSTIVAGNAPMLITAPIPATAVIATPAGAVVAPERYPSGERL